MSMAYIRLLYGVPAKRGARVRFKSDVYEFYGTIISAPDGYIRVRSDTDGRVHTLHPEWNVKYLQDAQK